MIPFSLRSVAPLGAVGIHASLLPKYRGGAPLVWAIINGEGRSGVTLFQLEDGIDSGDIFGQREFDIEISDDIAIVLSKAAETSVAMLREIVPQIESGFATRGKQDHLEASLFPQREPKDGLVNWSEKSAFQAHNWIRAQTRPYPGAFTYFANEKLTIWKSSALDLRSSESPGTFVTTIDGNSFSLGIVCADNLILEVKEVGCSDGRILSGAQFVEEFRLKSGSRAERI